MREPAAGSSSRSSSTAPRGRCSRWPTGRPRRGGSHRQPGRRGPAELDWGAAVTVVVAAEGYPGTAAAGDEISGLADAERMPGAYVLHAGTPPPAAGR